LHCAFVTHAPSAPERVSDPACFCKWNAGAPYRAPRCGIMPLSDRAKVRNGAVSRRCVALWSMTAVGRTRTSNKAHSEVIRRCTSDRISARTRACEQKMRVSGAIAAAAGPDAGEAAWLTPRHESAATPCACRDRAPSGDPPERAHSTWHMLAGGLTPAALCASIAPFPEVTLMRIQRQQVLNTPPSRAGVSAGVRRVPRRASRVPATRDAAPFAIPTACAGKRW